MFKFIFCLIIIIGIIYCFSNHIKIKFLTFFQPGYRKKDNKFGVYCYHGKQGSSKTQNVVSFLLENSDKKIFANVKSLKGVNYTYFNGLKTLLSLRNEHDCIIFYDEIFSILSKGTKFNEDILDFLSQMRKRNIIFLTTAQEWLEIPMTLRRYCRYSIKCSIKTFFGISIIIKVFGDAEKMKWSPQENEYVCPIINTIIEKGRKKIVNSYDTFEQISRKEIPFEEIKAFDEETIQTEEILPFDKEIDKKNIDNEFWETLSNDDLE